MARFSGYEIGYVVAGFFACFFKQLRNLLRLATVGYENAGKPATARLSRQVPSQLRLATVGYENLIHPLVA